MLPDEEVGEYKWNGRKQSEKGEDGSCQHQRQEPTTDGRVT